MGLRIALGELRSIPVKEMEKTADVETLGLHRQFKTLIQFEMLKWLPVHPLHKKCEEITKNRLVRKSQNHLIWVIYRKYANLLETDLLLREPLTPEPWKHYPDLAKFVLEEPAILSRNEQAGESKQPALSLPMLWEQCPSNDLSLPMLHEWCPSNVLSHVFTDGSTRSWFSTTHTNRLCFHSRLETFHCQKTPVYTQRYHHLTQQVTP